MLRSGIQQREGEILHIHDILEPIEEVLSEDSTLDVSQAMIFHEKTMGLGMSLRATVESVMEVSNGL